MFRNYDVIWTKVCNLNRNQLHKSKVISSIEHNNKPGQSKIINGSLTTFDWKSEKHSIDNFSWESQKDLVETYKLALNYPKEISINSWHKLLQWIYHNIIVASRLLQKDYLVAIHTIIRQVFNVGSWMKKIWWFNYLKLNNANEVQMFSNSGIKGSKIASHFVFLHLPQRFVQLV